MKTSFLKTFLKIGIALSCTLAITSCDILMMALMMGMASETPAPTSTYYPYSSTIPYVSSTPPSSNSSSSNTSNSSSTNNRSNYWEENYGDIKCHLCNGTGICKTCNGDGLFRSHLGTGELECPNCHSSQVGRCGKCGGKGTVYGFKKIN